MMMRGQWITDTWINDTWITDSLPGLPIPGYTDTWLWCTTAAESTGFRLPSFTAAAKSTCDVFRLTSRGCDRRVLNS